MVAPDGLDSVKAMDAWHEAHDGQWLETAPPSARAFARNWAARATDLIDSYDPDYVYFDDSGLPFGQIGLDVVAKAYSRHPGLVATAKELSDLQRQGVVEDLERGYSDRLRELPWQTCTCIGNWHYDRQIFELHRYVGAKAVIQRLADIVSKNGNLLLSVPVRGDGTIDEDERAILGELAAWMAQNGEAIFATRPWKVYGEGPTASPSGKFSEGGVKPYTGEDLRFTTKGGDLFVLAMEQPADGRLRVKALAAGSPGEVERVELPTGGAPLPFRRDGEALVVELPAGISATVPAVRIRARGLI
jgi:alpha-L-fucosidase